MTPLVPLVGLWLVGYGVLAGSCLNEAIVVESRGASTRLPDGLYRRHAADGTKRHSDRTSLFQDGDDDDNDHVGLAGGLHDGRPWYSDGRGHYLFWVRSSRQWALGTVLGQSPFLAAIESVATTPDRAEGSWNAFIASANASPLPGMEGSTLMEPAVHVHSRCITHSPTPRPTHTPTHMPTPPAASTPMPTPTRAWNVCSYLRVAAESTERHAHAHVEGVYRQRHGSWVRPRYESTDGAFFLQFDGEQGAWIIAPQFGSTLLISEYSRSPVPNGLTLKPAMGTTSAAVRVGCTTPPPTPAPTSVPTPVPTLAPTPKHHGLTINQMDAVDAIAQAAKAVAQEARFEAQERSTAAPTLTLAPSPPPTPLATMRSHLEGGGERLRLKLHAPALGMQLCGRVRLTGSWKDRHALQVAGEYVLRGLEPAGRPTYQRSTSSSSSRNGTGAREVDMWLYFRVDDSEWVVSHQLGAPPFTFVAESDAASPELISAHSWNELRGQHGYFAADQFSATCTIPRKKRGRAPLLPAPPPPLPPRPTTATMTTVKTTPPVIIRNYTAAAAVRPSPQKERGELLHKLHRQSPHSAVRRKVGASARPAFAGQYQLLLIGTGLASALLFVMLLCWCQRPMPAAGKVVEMQDAKPGAAVFVPAATAPFVPHIQHQATRSELESLAAAGRATYSIAAVPFGDVDD